MTSPAVYTWFPAYQSAGLMHAMSGNELSRVRTEFRLRPPEPTN